MIYIGIDPGTNTGVAAWDSDTHAWRSIQTMTIMEAIDLCRWMAQTQQVTIIMEDARLRKWFGNSGREQLQGAGSIKRDCTIWQEVFPDIIKVAPKSNKTKLSSEAFAKITGWDKRTSNHARDAAMLVFGK